MEESIVHKGIWHKTKTQPLPYTNFELRLDPNQLPPGSVGIYIWSSKFLKRRYGHIAIAFENEYVSFWPNLNDSTNSKEFEGLWHTAEDDSNAYQNGELEYVAKINGLNLQKMREKLEEIKAIAPKWYLLASTPLKKPTSLNCISVVIEILRAGGIEDLAGEEIIKQKADKYDKGVLPYRRNFFDSCVKCGLNCCCGKCMKAAVACLFCFSILVSIPSIAIIFLGGGPPDPISNWTREHIINELPPGLLYASLPFLLLFAGLLLYQRCSNVNNNEGNGDLLDFSKLVDDAVLALPEISDDVASIAQNTLEIPYDSFRGLVEHTVVPNGRIKEIINKVLINQKVDHRQDRDQSTQFIELKTEFSGIR